MTPASAPLVSHILLPLITHSSPRRTAVVRMPRRSEPAPGSVRPRQPRIWPCGHRCAATRAFCSSLPNSAQRAAGQPQVRGDDQAGRATAPADFLQHDALRRVGLPPPRHTSRGCSGPAVPAAPSLAGSPTGTRRSRRPAGRAGSLPSRRNLSPYRCSRRCSSASSKSIGTSRHAPIRAHCEWHLQRPGPPATTRRPDRCPGRRPG